MDTITLNWTEEQAIMRQIGGAIDKILDDAQGLDELRHEPVNWADLYCDGVEIVIDATGTKTYRAIVSEASPGADKLARYVEKQLDLLELRDVAVICVW